MEKPEQGASAVERPTAAHGAAGVLALVFDLTLALDAARELALELAHRLELPGPFD